LILVELLTVAVYFYFFRFDNSRVLMTSECTAGGRLR